ncbi:MAG: type IV toxin-antitoxin system AbiEi family antitoxin domain-containing protein [Vicinamibacteria bacterium]|nr:type IV toxin-antitoxin system AbiEi family antitoxin domain-containing protein [Vicinamibacteria bacterium]
MQSPIPLPSTFTFTQALRLGLTRRGLQALLDSGAIERRARGLFARTDSVADDPELAAVALVAPRATICLASALVRHELIDAIPGSIDLALPRGTRLPKTGLPVTWHRFAASTFEIGRRTIDVDGRKLGIYDPLRSIVDSFRLRHREGHEQGLEALKAWLRRRGSQPASLVAVARAVDPRAASAIARVLEILL